MGSNLIFKVRICLNPLKPFLQQGRSAFQTINTSVCKTLQLPPTARSLCTRDTNPNLGGRQTVRKTSGQSNSGHGGVKYKAVRHRQGELWEDARDSGGKSSTLRQKPSFPKSVFSAGTAKRTAEMLRRKAALASEEEEETEEESGQRSTRRAGRTELNHSCVFNIWGRH